MDFLSFPYLYYCIGCSFTSCTTTSFVVGRLWLSLAFRRDPSGRPPGRRCSIARIRRRRRRRRRSFCVFVRVEFEFLSVVILAGDVSLVTDSESTDFPANPLVLNNPAFSLSLSWMDFMYPILSCPSKLWTTVASRVSPELCKPILTHVTLNLAAHLFDLLFLFGQ